MDTSCCIILNTFFLLKIKTEALKVDVIFVCVCVRGRESWVIGYRHAGGGLRSVQSVHFPVVMMPEAMQSQQIHLEQWDCVLPPAGTISAWTDLKL